MWRWACWSTHRVGSSSKPASIRLSLVSRTLGPGLSACWRCPDDNQRRESARHNVAGRAYTLYARSLELLEQLNLLMR